ncbi:MAG TPA: hypothetical protein DD979_00375 [Gammaproteobacteria bacterium]|jgi:hypothetical protein|nr:hypothetical protein [Gammaproteobacteria bacterium]
MPNQSKGLRAVARFATVLLLLSVAACNPGSALTSSEKWSDTQPAINLEHVFFGEINKRGRPTGYHARPGGKDPQHARVARIVSKANPAGVYTARIEVYDKDQQQWREKFSSMFPDTLSREDVIQAITHAYHKRDKSKNQPWSGPSGLGFPIQGYVLNDGRINTAFPVYLKP